MKDKSSIGKSHKLTSNNHKPIEKRYNKDGTKCKVTFRLPAKAAKSDSNVCLAGEFNNWDIENTQLKKLKNGEFKVIVDLQLGREYRFKYLINGTRWENHWNADKYVLNEYGSKDSVVIL